MEQIKSLQEANEKLIALQALEKQHAAIIGSLSNIFFVLYYIDIEKNIIQEVISLNNKGYNFVEKGNAQTFLTQMVDMLVENEYKAIMNSFLDLETLNNRFQINLSLYKNIRKNRENGQGAV